MRFLGSSTVERRAVNPKVAGSNPARGVRIRAKYRLRILPEESGFVRGIDSESCPRSQDSCKVSIANPARGGKGRYKDGSFTHRYSG